MSVIDTIITDRAQSDVDRAKQLAEKISAGTATQAEITEYLTDLKGSYNASDLNRVGTACAYLYGLLSDYGYIVTDYIPLRTDWALTDIPTQAQMSDYIQTVAALKAVLGAAQIIPASMEKINYQDANNIEKLLLEVDDLIKRVTAVFVRSGAWNAVAGLTIYAMN